MMEIILEFSDPVVMQEKHTISVIKFLATGRADAKTLVEYNNNNSEENGEKEKEQIDLEFAEQKADPYNNENAVDFKWSDVKVEDEEDIVLTNLIESLQK